MSEASVYSFADVTVSITHPLKGAKIADGLGIGKVSTDFTDDLTNSDLGADGSVMVTKINSQRGTVDLDIQQTSSLNKWLIDLANAVVAAPAASWASTTITIQEKFPNGITTTASKVALVKRPSRENGQTGAHVTWRFFSANMTQV